MVTNGSTLLDICLSSKLFCWVILYLAISLSFYGASSHSKKTGRQGILWHGKSQQERRRDVVRHNFILCNIRGAQKLNATCMDGTDAMFYLDRNFRSRNWIIHLQAGGSCVTEEDCIHRANGPLGSSLYLNTFITGKLSLSRDHIVNPTFHQWNKVFIPYCSGDVFVGRMPKKSHPFRIPMLGHYIVLAVMKQLMQDYAINTSETKILFGGTSAGGLGALANIDLIQQMTYPAEVKGYNDGGWFTLFPNFGEKFFDPGLPKFFNVLTELFDKYWNGFVDESCRAQMPKAAACLYGELAIKHISTPMYIMVAQWDSYQLTKLVARDFRPVPLPPKKRRERNYVSLFGNNTRRSLEMVNKIGKSGVFSPACYSHTFLTSCIDGNICQYPPSDTFHIQGRTAYQALTEWYVSSGIKGTYIEEISDVPSCNPSCCSLFCLKCKLPPLQEEVETQDQVTPRQNYQLVRGKNRVFYYSSSGSAFSHRFTVLVLLAASFSLSHCIR